MNTAVYPGTFDPLTNGHLDLIARGAKIVDQLVVAILRNAEKGVPLFTVEERREMIEEAIAEAGFRNVSVATFDGLLVDYARKRGAGDNQFKLYVRTGFDGAEHLLVDPEALAKSTGSPHAINFYTPSNDGRLVAYGMSEGGSD